MHWKEIEKDIAEVKYIHPSNYEMQMPNVKSE